MSKKQINITNEVMKQIRTGKVTMRPRIYFIIGSILTFAGLVGSIVTSVFLISLTRFALLHARFPMGQFRLDQLVSSFPWWAPVLAVLALAVGIWFLRMYDFSYKKNFFLLSIGFITAIIIAAWIINATGLDNIWLRHGPMRGIMMQYMQENGMHPSPRWMQ